MATPDKINDVPNYGEQVPFLPRELYKAGLDVKKIYYHDGYKGKAFIAYVVPYSCTTDALRIGHQYSIRFPRDQDKTKDQARMTEFKRFIAAVSGSKTLEGFDADAAIATYCELGDDLPSAGLKVEVETSNRKANKPDKDGKFPVYTNFTYFPQ